MSQCIRMRWLAAWLALSVALALPLSGMAAEDEAPADAEQAEAQPSDDEAEAAEDASEEAGDEEEAEDEGASAIDWDVTHRGIYLIANGGYAFIAKPGEIEDEAREAAGLGDVNSNVDDSWSYGGRLGYRLFERLALEGQFEMLNDIAIHQRQESDGSNHNSKATFLTATGNAKAYLLTQRIQPYALAGAGYGHVDLNPPGDNADDRHSGFVARFGIGADFYVTEDLGLMTEVSYVLPTGGVSAYDNVVIAFGAMLRFYGGD